MTEGGLSSSAHLPYQLTLTKLRKRRSRGRTSADSQRKRRRLKTNEREYQPGRNHWTGERVIEMNYSSNHHVLPLSAEARKIQERRTGLDATFVTKSPREDKKATREASAWRVWVNFCEYLGYSPTDLLPSIRERQLQGQRFLTYIRQKKGGSDLGRRRGSRCRLPRILV